MSSTPFSPMRRHLLATSVAAGVSAMLPRAACGDRRDRHTPVHRAHSR